MHWTGTRRAAGLALAVVFLLAAAPAAALPAPMPAELPAELPDAGPEVSLWQSVVGWVSGLWRGEAGPEGLQQALGAGYDPNGTEAETQDDDPTSDPELGHGYDPDG